MSTPYEFPPYSPAASAQASPAEIARAVAAVEARRATVLNSPSNTIQIGDAIHQLGLNVSPEELLAEVQMQRSAPGFAPASGRPARSNANSAALLAFSIVLGGMLFLGVSFFTLVALARHNVMAATPEEISVSTPPAFTTVEAVPSEPETKAVASDLATTAEEDSSDDTAFATLSRVEDNTDVAVDFDTLTGLANGASPTEVKVLTHFGSDDKLWAMKRVHGKLLVYCYAPEHDTVAAVNKRKIHVYASPHDNMNTVMLPIEVFQSASFIDTPDMAGAIVNTNNAFSAPQG